MENQNFKLLVQRLKNSKTALLGLLVSAKENKNAEQEDYLMEILDDSHPGWDDPAVAGNAKGHQKPMIKITFKQTTHRFEHGYQAYAWLMDEFIKIRAIDIATSNWEEKFINDSNARKYIAETSDKLFLKSPHLANRPHTYQRLSNGWYLNTTLNSEEKFEVLARYAAIIDLKDWVWEVEGEEAPTLEELIGGFLSSRI